MSQKEKNKPKQGNWWWRRFLLSFVPFVIFSIGFIPILVVIVVLYYFISLPLLIWLILLPFLIVILLMLLFVSQLLISGTLIRLFHITYEEGTYAYSLRNKTTFKWLLLCQLYTPMRKLMEIIPMGGLRITYLRLLGMKIGKNCLVGGVIKDPCMTSFGDKVTMGEYAVLYAHIHDKSENLLHISPVTIGDACVIGAGAIIMPGAYMEKGSILGAGGLVPKNKVLKKGVLYTGQPVQEKSTVKKT